MEALAKKADALAADIRKLLPEEDAPESASLNLAALNADNVAQSLRKAADLKAKPPKAGE